MVSPRVWTGISLPYVLVRVLTDISTAAAAQQYLRTCSSGGRGGRCCWQHSPQAMPEPARGFRLDVVQANHMKDRELRRARQEEYRRELNSQVADGEERRELNARRIRELEERHEQKSVSLVMVTYGGRVQSSGTTSW